MAAVVVVSSASAASGAPSPQAPRLRPAGFTAQATNLLGGIEGAGFDALSTAYDVAIGPAGVEQNMVAGKVDPFQRAKSWAFSKQHVSTASIAYKVGYYGAPLLLGPEAEADSVVARVATSGARAAEDAGASAAERVAASCGGASFTCGSRVLLASGAAIPISQLKPGDKVLATNTKTGKTQAEPVSAVLVHHDTNRYDLRVKTAHGSAVIDTTATHLFWDRYLNQWIPAAKLKKGERLKTADGVIAVADGGTTTNIHDGWMWDVTIPGDHDFYIDVATTAVLVHNCAAGPTGRGLQDILNASTRTFTRYLQSVQGAAAQAGRATITPEESQQLWDEAMARGFTAPRGPEQEWVGGPHINIYAPNGGANIHFPLPDGWLPPGY